MSQDIKISPHKKQIMCKKQRTLGGQEYNVEIAIKSGKILLSASSLTLPETILVEIPENKSKCHIKYRQSNT